MITLPPTLLCSGCGDELPRRSMPNGVCSGCTEIEEGHAARPVPAHIEGKYPTGPNCYAGAPIPHKGKPIGIDRLCRSGGRNNATTLTADGLERCRQGGIKGGAARTVRMTTDLADLARSIMDKERATA